MSTKGRIAIIILIILLAITIIYLIWPKSYQSEQKAIINTINLPQPQITGDVSVEQAIYDRRSVRRYSNEPLSIEDVSQLLWAAQGITDPNTKFRTTPSGGHTFPLEVYIIIGKGSVPDLKEGVYHYNPFNHSIEQILETDSRSDLAQAADGQPWVKEAPVDIVITGNYQKMMEKYKDEKVSMRFVDMEAGHAGQNIYLQAQARNLATVALGSFKDDQVHQILKIPSNENTLYIYPVGHPQT